MAPVSGNHLQPLNFPSVGLDVALHHRSNTFYLILTHPYGLSSGYNIYADLNCPQPQDLSPDPPTSYPHLNQRKWLRDGRDRDGGKEKISFGELMGVEPSMFKDSGLRRKVNASDSDCQCFGYFPDLPLACRSLA